MTKRPVLGICLAIAGLLPLAPGSQAQPHKSKPHKAAPPKVSPDSPGVWRPNPLLIKQLAPEVSLGDYGIHPPQGYDFEVQTREQDKEMISMSQWTGEKRPDHSQAGIWIFIAAPKPGYHPDDVEKQVDSFQEHIVGKLSHITQSPREEGSIHDVAFTRLYWKGTDTDTKSQVLEHVHGFTYVAVDSYTILIMIAEDSEPHNQTTLPLLEAAAETLRRQ